LRLDIFLSKTGIVKRRSIAKTLAENGLIKINDIKAKPSKELAINDIIKMGGNRPGVFEVIEMPIGSVKKEDREKYFRKLD